MKRLLQNWFLQRQWPAIVLVAGVYYLAALPGMSFALPQTNATAIWAPSGIALSALLLWGRRLWPAVALGSFLTNITVLLQAGIGTPHQALLASVLISFGNTLEALIGRFLFIRYIGDAPTLRRSHDPLILALTAAVSCTVAAVMGVTTMTVVGLFPGQLAGPVWLTWWLGDLAGILIITPLILAIHGMPAFPSSRRLLIESLFLVTVGITAFFLLTGNTPHGTAIAYLILPLVLVPAIWSGPSLTQLSVALVAGIAVYGAVHRQGPFQLPSVHSSLLLAQGFASVLALAASTLATAIAERKMREHALSRMYRNLQVLTRCNAAVVHAKDEHQLLQEVCQVAVETAGYELACVVYAEHDEAKSVRPIAYAGPAERFLSRVRVSWGDNEYGWGTIGTTIRTGRPVIAADLLQDPGYHVWRDLVIESGFRSSAAVPLQAHGTMYGAIGFFTREPDAFKPSEMDLLVELGANLAHGILTLRTRADNARLYEQVQRYAAELEQRVQQRTAELQREVARREQAQISLQDSERKYRELVENANSIILKMDRNGCITFLNEFGQRFLGYTESELLGRNVVGTIVPRIETGGRDLERLMEETATHPDQHTSNENENLRRDGTRVWISWTNRPIHDREGRLTGCLSVGNDITALKQTQAQLEVAKEAAESADRLKSAFMATMSHELRTPLNSIIGFTGILLQELPGPLNSEQRNQLGMVRNAARHLLALINDVLDISKIEAGQLTVERVPFDLPRTINQVIETVMPLAREKRLQLVTDIAPDIQKLDGDQRRFEQVLLNLLSNAIKFTEQGQVTLRCAREPGWVVISVRDTGCGISEQDQATLFRPFRQLDTGLARKHEGTGLGLAICKRLVDIMKGRIELSSKVGEGSVFTVRLPQP